MEIKVTITLWLFSILSLILNYHIKYNVANLSTTLLGAQNGLLTMLILNVILRRIKFFQHNFSIFSPKESTLDSFLCGCLGGVFLGAYGGFNLSVIDATWDLPAFKSWLIFSHCAGSWGTAVILYIAECSYWCRYVFSMIYSSNQLKPLSVSEHLSSFLCIVVICDYSTTIGIIYLGFFLVMYYCVYLVASTYPFWSWLLVGGFCGCNFLMNLIRICYLRPKMLQKNAEKEFRESFPFTV